MNLGIEEHTGFVYEGRGFNGHAAWPSPVLCPANIIDESVKELETIKKNNIYPYVFKEDAYDMKSRLRRGQLYWRSDFTQPSQWFVAPHPMNPNEPTGFHQKARKDLLTFASIDFFSHIKNKNINKPLILIGTEESFSIWSVVSVETSITGNQLITLHSRLVIGALPNIDYELIPAQGREHVIKFLEILSNEINSAGPASIIDRSRETLSAILSTYLRSLGIDDAGEDLAKLAGLLEKNSNKDVITISLSKAVARLHPRGKSSEQRKRPGLRELHERDAELAVQSVGTVLCDLGWAKW